MGLRIPPPGGSKRREKDLTARSGEVAPKKKDGVSRLGRSGFLDREKQKMLRRLEKLIGFKARSNLPAFGYSTASNVSDKAEVSADDMPIEMENPFKKELPKCILCKYEIEPDFKNVRLLSQFVSKFTGRIYGRHITGLCLEKHKKVQKEIVKARAAGLMAYYLKEPRYLADPSLYNEMNPLKPHKFI